MDPTQRVSKDKLEEGGRRKAVHHLTTQMENFHRQMRQSSLEHPGSLCHSQYLTLYLPKSFKDHPLSFHQLIFLVQNWWKEHPDFSVFWAESQIQKNLLFFFLNCSKDKTLSNAEKNANLCFCQLAPRSSVKAGHWEICTLPGSQGTKEGNYFCHFTLLAMSHT